MLANLDATLPLFDTTGDPSLIPAVRRVQRGTIFRHGEQTRRAPKAKRRNVTYAD